MANGVYLQTHLGELMWTLNSLYEMEASWAELAYRSGQEGKWHQSWGGGWWYLVSQLERVTTLIIPGQWEAGFVGLWPMRGRDTWWDILTPEGNLIRGDFSSPHLHTRIRTEPDADKEKWLLWSRNLFPRTDTFCPVYTAPRLALLLHFVAVWIGAH